MRINVYAEELIDDASAVEIVEKVADTGARFIGVRFFLKSAPELHHHADDDDRTAITFWVRSSKAGFRPRDSDAMLTLLERAKGKLREYAALNKEEGARGELISEFPDHELQIWQYHHEDLLTASLAAHVRRLRAELDEARTTIEISEFSQHHVTMRAEQAERERDEARREMKRLREEVRTTLLAEEERRKLTGDALAAEADAARWAARCIAVLHDDLSAADRYEWEREAAALAADGAGKRGGE